MSTIPAEIARALKDARRLAFEANMRTNVRVDEITPYTETKTAYYGEKEKTFFDVPKRNVSIFFDNYEDEYQTKRIGNRFIVLFPEKLQKATNITVMVQ